MNQFGCINHFFHFKYQKIRKYHTSFIKLSELSKFSKRDANIQDDKKLNKCYIRNIKCFEGKRYYYIQKKSLLQPPSGFKEISSDEKYSEEISYQRNLLIFIALIALAVYIWEEKAKSRYSMLITNLHILNVYLFDLTELLDKITALEKRIKLGQQNNVDPILLDIWIKELYNLMNNRDEIYNNFFIIASQIFKTIDNTYILFALAMWSDYFTPEIYFRAAKSSGIIQNIFNILKKEVSIEKKQAPNPNQMLFIGTCIELLVIGSKNTEIAEELIKQDIISIYLKILNTNWVPRNMIHNEIIKLLTSHTHNILQPEQIIQIIKYSLNSKNEEDLELLERCISILRFEYAYPIKNKIRNLFEKSQWNSLRRYSMSLNNILDLYPWLNRKIYIILSNNRDKLSESLKNELSENFLTSKKNEIRNYIKETQPIWGSILVGFFASWWVAKRSHRSISNYHVIKKRKRVAFIFTSFIYLFESYFSTLYPFLNQYWTKFYESYGYDWKHIDASNLYIIFKMIWLTRTWLYCKFMFVPILFLYCWSMVFELSSIIFYFPNFQDLIKNK